MRRYHVTTFGCQMNAHDSERIKGMLEELGLGEATAQEEADVLVFNTCTIREKPDTKFAAYLGHAIARKRENPDTVIAVGGCYAEAQRERLFELYPEVDVAFGPGSIPHLGEWLGAGGFGVARGAFGLDARSFAGELPMRRERRFQAWVQISMGCNSKCSYCIVPAVRGREQSRRPGEIVAEATRLASDGVRELTLLGQNVNSWGRDLLPDLRTEFGELLRACDAIEGIERIRFTSPHPKDFRAPVIAAMAECASVCEHAHLPLQSGSTRVLKAMRRTYSRERYLRLVDELRAAIPDLALTTDIIVGFPGETEDDFRETVEVVEQVRYDGAFTFVYSPRAGTEAATMPDQVPEEVKRERIERLIDVVQRVAHGRNAERVGRVEEVLVEGPSRTDSELLRGRTRRNTTVNFTGTAAPGELADVRIQAATSTTLRGAQAVPVAA
jgi:tRNA-2-methylthio-N6-dimethylallyladenosine synthase